MEIIQARINDIRSEIASLEQQQAMFLRGGSEQIALPESAPHGDGAKKKQAERLPYRRFVSSDNIPLLVGKSARDSDELTLRCSKGNEWFVHVRDVPGAHVLVKSSLDALPERTLVEAAMLAQHFSKARTSARATVSYTRIKYVQKKKGMPAGKVLITQEKTIDIISDQAVITALMSRSTPAV